MVPSDIASSGSDFPRSITQAPWNQHSQQATVCRSRQKRGRIATPECTSLPCNHDLVGGDARLQEPSMETAFAASLSTIIDLGVAEPIVVGHSMPRDPLLTSVKMSYTHSRDRSYQTIPIASRGIFTQLLRGAKILPLVLRPQIVSGSCTCFKLAYDVRAVEFLQGVLWTAQYLEHIHSDRHAVVKMSVHCFPDFQGWLLAGGIGKQCESIWSKSRDELTTSNSVSRRCASHQRQESLRIAQQPQPYTCANWSSQLAQLPPFDVDRAVRCSRHKGHDNHTQLWDAYDMSIAI